MLQLLPYTKLEDVINDTQKNTQTHSHTDTHTHTYVDRHNVSFTHSQSFSLAAAGGGFCYE